ncbi:MAG: ATPase [Oscillospiraceae bacterium]|nr:ATPase [Oscillospiraceae bacterium]
MSIEKMELVNIAGLTKDLDTVLVKLSDCGCFHIESATKMAGKKTGFTTLKEENPYTPLLKQLSEISTQSGVKFTSVDYKDVENESLSKLERYIRGIRKKLDIVKDKETKAAELLSVHEQAVYQVDHLQGIHADFEQLFACEHIKMRLGRLPVDSYSKLSYYDDKPFYFKYFSTEKEYYWGMYFVPVAYQEDVDGIFADLYFERTHIPDFVRGDPSEASKELHKMVEDDQKAIEDCKTQYDEILNKEMDRLCRIFSRLKSQHDNFDLRNKAAIVNDKFYIVGFIPKRESDSFLTMFDDLESVSVVLQPADANGKLEPPIKLKNNKFTEPFSMFVDMYGLPSYNGINPTAFVAVTYTLLFGIMFGDVGQGLVLAIAGALLWKFKKFALGPIITRVGISGAVFGLLYGSVFGYEELLDPVYESLGITFLPFKVMHNVTTILIGAIAIGVLIMIISILINVVTGIKNKKYEEALFGNNGIAGLVFFGSLLAGAVGTLFGVKMFTPVYVICLIILPLAAMFLREPLTYWVRGKKFEMEGGMTDFIASNFFEVFEFLLGYATNTLSFVRIGGFVLSHASMMLVVMALANHVSNVGVPLVVIFGNIFVMGLEGLLVGIQTLRLEFYEIFSRFYSGDGKPFTPVKINYDENIE